MMNSMIESCVVSLKEKEENSREFGAGDGKPTICFESGEE